MESLVTIGYICLCVLFFSLAIAIHEFGHFIVALKLGLRVERFSIGFGPAIWKKTWRGVEYRVSWLPLGGYVMIPDIDPEGTKALEGGGGEPRARVAPWKELLVAFAGPAMNIVLAVVLAVVLSLLPGVRFGETEAVIGGVLDDSAAGEGGLASGDRVLSVAGNPVRTWSEMLTEIQIAGARKTEFVVDRGGERVALSIVPRRDEASGFCMIGAHSRPDGEGVPGTWLPVRDPAGQILHDAGAIFRVLKGLVTPKEMKTTAAALGGPVNIAEGIYRSMRRDVWDGVGFLRFLNVNLAVVNLLPVPVLDGGLILFALIAIVTRRRVPQKIVSALSMCFMVLLLGLMAVLFYRDSVRSWRVHRAISRMEKSASAGGGEDRTPADADSRETEGDAPQKRD